MSIKHLTPAHLEAWLEALIAAGTVYGVQAKGDHFAFGQLGRPGQLRLDYDVTILPPKKYFMPPKEVLLTYDRHGRFESVLDETPFVVFGVHPYDMVAINQLDAIFAAGHADGHYLSRRAAATVVVCDVQTPSSDTFAGCMGTATLEGREGHDLLLTPLEDGTYLADPRTAKGEALLAALPGAAPDAAPAALAARDAIWARNREQLQKHKLKVPLADLPLLLAETYDHPVWSEKAELCYSCGSCNLVCPTCYCFDIDDELDWDLEHGRRTRTWDGCMLTPFAVVAGNHNFRAQKAARYRHRYLRKGQYVPEVIGEIACVGCGRCITACTANIANPVEIFNTLAEVPV